jgi:hypothetical protein
MLKLLVFACVVFAISCATLDLAPSKDVTISREHTASLTTEWFNNEKLIWSYIGPSDEHSLIGFNIPQEIAANVDQVSQVIFTITANAVTDFTDGSVSVIDPSVTWSETTTTGAGPSALDQVAGTLARDAANNVVADVTAAFKQNVRQSTVQFGLYITGFNGAEIKSRETLPNGYFLHIVSTGSSTTAPSTSAPVTTSTPSSTKSPVTTSSPASTAVPTPAPTSGPTTPTTAPTQAPTPITTTTAPTTAPTRAPTPVTTTTAPTSAPTTSAPTTAPIHVTTAPTTSPTTAPTREPTQAPAPVTTRSSESTTSAPGITASPAPTKATTTTPTAQSSGQNNAKTANSAVKNVTGISIIALVLAIALLK